MATASLPVQSPPAGASSLRTLLDRQRRAFACVRALIDWTLEM